MSEMRFDPLTEQWTVLAPDRAKRPHVPSDSREHCPFCPGHEGMTPPDLLRVPAGDSGWRLRVVPNKYPVFRGPLPAKRHRDDAGFLSMETAGAHEVVIESPDHDWDLSAATCEEARLLIDAYRERYRALRESQAAAVVIYRNRGERSGTSIQHPHSQVVASPIVPPLIRQHVNFAARHFDVYGQGLYHEVREKELKVGVRVVLENEGFVVFEPYAPKAPFETWLLPRRHHASFGDIDDDEVEALSEILPRTLRALDRALDRPHYNMLIQSAPLEDEHLAYFLWHLRIVPRLGIPAGFELATGISISPALPEEAAALLREALQKEQDSTT